MKRGAPGSVMSPRIRVLLLVIGSIVLGSVAVTFYVGYRSRMPPLARRPAADPVLAEVPPEALPSPQTDSRTQHVASRPSGVSPQKEPVGDIPATASRELVVTEAEHMTHEMAEEIDRKQRDGVVRELDLSPSQVSALEPVLSKLGSLARSMSVLSAELHSELQLLRSHGRDSGWTAEQVDEACSQAGRRFVSAHLGEYVENLESTSAAIEELRPHLRAEQTVTLDAGLTKLQTAKARLLRGQPMFDEDD